MGVDKKNDGCKKKVVFLLVIGKMYEFKVIVVEDWVICIVFFLFVWVIFGVLKGFNVSVIFLGFKSIFNCVFVFVVMGEGIICIKGLFYFDDMYYMLIVIVQF